MNTYHEVNGELVESELSLAVLAAQRERVAETTRKIIEACEATGTTIATYFEVDE